MTQPSHNPERLIMAKELVDHFGKQGVPISYHYARQIISACPQAVRGRYVRASEAWSWWVLHPDFKPFGDPSKPESAPRPARPASSRAIVTAPGETLPLLAAMERTE